MTAPDDGRLHADLDGLGSAAGRWGAMTGDLEPGPAPSPGDLSNPTSQATLTIHGTTQLSSAQLMGLLGDYAGKTSGAAGAMHGQEGQSVSQLKDVMSMVTGIPKDITSGISPLFSAASTAASSASSAMSATVSSVTSAIKPVTDALGKTSAPGGTVAGGLTSVDNLNHPDTTTREGDHGGSSDTGTSAQLQHRSPH